MFWDFMGRRRSLTFDILSTIEDRPLCAGLCELNRSVTFTKVWLR